MGTFIQNNTTWLVPIVSIALTLLIKISSKPEFISLNYKDFTDFGFDLSITSMILLLTNIKNDVTGIWLLLLSFVLIMIASVFVNRIGWNKESEEPRLIGIVIPDILGISLLIMATLYSGGKIK